MKIKKLAVENYKNVAPLFHDNYPNLPFVYGVIEGILAGEIWADNEDQPKVCLITSEANYCFIAGQLDQKVFDSFYDILKKRKLVKLVCEPISHNHQINLLDYGFKPVARVQYHYKNLQDVPQYQNDSEYELRQISDQNIFNKCIWHSFITNMYGDANKYLKLGLGFILWDNKNQRIASEAHGIVANNLIEVGTITDEAYRKQGLSTKVCNKLIRDAVSKGLHPIWTCDETNEASNKVAQNQAMNDKNQYTFYTLQKM